MIAVASDHAGFELKQEIIRFLEEENFSFRDFGTDSTASCDYAVYAYKAAKAIQSGECVRGILVCGTGIGISIAANKMKGIRCAVCSDCFSAVLSREHNDSNMIAFGSRVVGPGLARLITQMWLDAGFQGQRHQRRIDQINDIENGQAPKEL
ncbi:MAG: ribose 5-phosphate isomerase B [Spirochaetaceae bacterium]|jgi:ribose 5-phosphate isomerase B|nr:ribose 5-phosphate isomerase B [Spirochaetaceae bacterium]